VKFKQSAHHLWTEHSRGQALYEDARGNLYRFKGTAVYPKHEFKAEPFTGKVVIKHLLCVNDQGYGFMADVRFRP